ncbi:hypothetical protein HZH68_008662 [Vespula germanica]|uniref:Uncharacterized protein n=1 Tax=Vespula germanica TaxID=30212 RepID=A0A834N5F8_VESGE|nr:hypothetical protein HZH68_008662 [Vespula germanica]
MRNDVSNDELKVITLNAGGRVVNCFPPLRRDLRTCKSYIVSYTNIEKQRSGKYNFPPERLEKARHWWSWWWWRCGGGTAAAAVVASGGDGGGGGGGGGGSV